MGRASITRVLAGEATSVLPEGLGLDEKGVDVWVQEHNGRRVGHQCKRENGTKAKWPIAYLAKHNILRNADYQLRRNETYHFAFVSSDPSPILSDLIERTGTCNDDPSQFVKYSVTSSSEHIKGFKGICNNLDLDNSKPEDQATAFEFLKRFEILSFARGKRAKDEIKAWARLAVEGDPQTVVSVLGDFLIDNIGNELYADQISTHLRQHGLPQFNEPRNSCHSFPQNLAVTMQNFPEQDKVISISQVDGLHHLYTRVKQAA